MEHGTTVVNIRNEPYDILITRPGKWGNPFRVGRDGNREEVLAKFRYWIMNDGSWKLMNIHELIGKRLGCWCPPQACHGNIYVEIINSLYR